MFIERTKDRKLQGVVTAELCKSCSHRLIPGCTPICATQSDATTGLRCSEKAKMWEIGCTTLDNHT